MKSIFLFFAFILSIANVNCGCTKTLYFYDPIDVGLSFANGTGSVSYTDYWPYNAGADMCWGEYNWGQFTLLGSGQVVDLGTPSELRAEYQTGNVLPESSIYGTIHYSSGELVLGKDFYKNFMPFSSETIAQLDNTQQMVAFNATVGHIYLINVVDSYPSNAQRIIKMMVINIDSVYSVTIRWDVILEATYNGAYDQCFDEMTKKFVPTVPSSPVSDAWILGCIISLFCLFIFIVILLIILLVKLKKNHTISELSRLVNSNDQQHPWLYFMRACSTHVLLVSNMASKKSLSVITPINFP